MIGLGTYAFYWQWHPTAVDPLSLAGMLRKTTDMGCDLFQICDYGPLDEMDDSDYRGIARLADSLGIQLQLGTRGLERSRLERYLELAAISETDVVRGMVRREEADHAVDLLREVVPLFERQGVVLALETYEQVETERLIDIVKLADSDNVGICLDPGNSVASLEAPREVIAATAGLVANLHVKDFQFSRQDGWVGFTYAGAKLGTGMLDHEYMLAKVDPVRNGIDMIVEQWVVWQGDHESTLAVENEWNEHSVNVLRKFAGRKDARS